MFCLSCEKGQVKYRRRRVFVATLLHYVLAVPTPLSLVLSVA